MSVNASIKTERRRNAEAAVWHTRLERGQLTPYESVKYEAWSADAENVRALSQVRHVWDAWGEPSISSGSLPVRAPSRRLRVFGALAAVAAALACFALCWVLMARQPSFVEERVVETQSERLQDYALPDKTLVSLRPNTRLKFKMDGAQRNADVPHGEVFFDVASDPRRPFVVRVREGSVRAVGTRFAVRQLDGPASVVVEEGKVHVERAPGDQGISVAAGQQLTILPSGKMMLEAVDARKKLAWARKVMSFAGKTVAQIAEEFNRRNELKIKIADARLGNEVFGLGVFYLDDPEHFVEVLQTRSKVTVERIEPNTLRLLTASQADAGGR